MCGLIVHNVLHNYASHSSDKLRPFVASFKSYSKKLSQKI